MNNSEVREIAKMQRHIDDYEACMDYLFCLIYKTDKEPIMASHDDNIWWFRQIEYFLMFVRQSHPEIIEEFMSKEQEEQTSLTEQLQAQKATPPLPFLKRSFSELWHRLSNHQDGE